MNHTKSTLALAVIAAIGLTGCGGSSSGGGGGNGDDGGDGGGNNPDSQNFQTDFSNSDRYGVTVDNGLTIDNGTLAIVTSQSASADFDGPFSTPEGNEVTPNAWHGAVDPSAPAADGDPSSAGPFWDGWTYRNSALSTNLPGSNSTAYGTDTNFHPLEVEIRNGDIKPASTPDCSSIADGLADGGTTDVFGVNFPVCVISDGDLDGNYTLTNKYIYVLGETIQVGNGDVEGASDPSTVDNFTLTVEAGTQIMGDDDAQSSLVITRGSEIDVNGTAELPIIFGGVTYDGTKITDDVTDLNDRGAWGSLVLAGYGEINIGNDDNQAQTEAVPDGKSRWYGGTDNSDSSGTVEYAVVAETGTAFRQDEEVQGITLEAVGSGSNLSHVQVINSDDDGIEWFGGAINVDNIVIQAPTDDPLDQDQGWQGTGKTALIIMGPNFGNRGMESDGNGDDFGATPKTMPVWTNVTILGHLGNEADQSIGALHREGYGGQVYRSVYTDNTSSVAGGATGTAEFQEGCLDVDDELDEDLEYGDVLFNCANGALSDDDDTL